MAAIDKRPMQIVRLEMENVKRINAVQITPEGAVIEITGANGQGKTSIIDAIEWLFGGKEAMQGMPLRSGAESGFIRATLREIPEGETEKSEQAELGNLIVTRTLKRREDGTVGTSIIVAAKDGARYPSPQKMLDDLYGQISFDPLAFTKLKPAQQYETIRKTVKIDADLDEIDRLNKNDYDRRTFLNAQAEAARGAANAIAVPDNLPDAPVDVAALMDRLTRAGTHNAEILERQRNRAALADQNAADRARAAAQPAISEAAVQQIEAGRDKIVEALEAQIAQLQKQIGVEMQTAREIIATEKAEAARIVAEATAAADAGEQRLANAEALPEPIDSEALRIEIEAAQETNAGIAKRADKLVKTAEAAGFEKEAQECTDRRDARTAKKQDAIAAAKMPVEGLSFGDDVLLLDGVPFEQASGAEQLRASVAIAMAANPQLHVLLIRDGNGLDSKSLKLLSEMVTDQRYQVWMEEVDETGAVGIVIEDGRVKTVNAPRPSLTITSGGKTIVNPDALVPLPVADAGKLL